MISDNCSKKISNIIIVDDVTANLKVLGDILEGEGYKVRPVLSGILALMVAEKEKPDLILLDIMMPDMDGYEVCSKIKKNPKLCDIPIIFISALNEISNIVKAFEAGGSDYITKPFQAEEVKARVATHLKLYQQSKELLDLNATKDKFFSIIGHDLRGPLSGLMGLTEIMAGDIKLFSPDEEKKIMKTLNQTAKNTYNLLENLLEWSKLHQGITSFSPFNQLIKPIIEKSLLIELEAAKNKDITITTSIDDNIEVYADLNILQTVIRNLVSNAVKFTPKGGTILISSKTYSDNTAIISIKDSGIGMNSAMVSNLFRIDLKTNRQGTEGEPSSGLGLILCKDFIEKHGGKIWVESEEGTGSIFSFTLPPYKNSTITNPFTAYK